MARNCAICGNDSFDLPRDPVYNSTLCHIYENRKRAVIGYLVYDDNCESPRIEQENLGVMACFHKRHNLGDEHDIRSQDFKSWDEIKTHIVKNLGAAVILPLYLYDHSGLVMSTAPFTGREPHAEWDSGRVGWIYATSDSIRRYCGVQRISKECLEKATRQLEHEVEVYSSFLEGDMYGVCTAVFARESEEDFWELAGDGLPEFETDDPTCERWGFYGSSAAKTELARVIEDLKLQLNPGV